MYTVDIHPISGLIKIYVTFVQGKKDEFTKHYRTQRRKQVRLAIKPQGAWVGKCLSVCRLMYSNIECSISIHREETSMILRSSSLELLGEKTLYLEGKGGMVVP